MKPRFLEPAVPTKESRSGYLPLSLRHLFVANNKIYDTVLGQMDDIDNGLGRTRQEPSP